LQPVCRNLSAHYQFGLAEEISLKVGKAHIAGLRELLAGLHFFRQHFALWRAEAADEPGALFDARSADVYLNDVRKIA
jgi:hypothetical protein